MTAQTEYATPAAPQIPPARPFWTRTRIVVATAAGTLLAALLALAGVGLIAPHPVTATSVLKSDGYSPISQAALSDMGAGMPASLAPYVSGYAAGTRPGTLEVVAILTPAGMAKVTQAEVAGMGDATTTATLNGDVLRVDETS